MRHNFLPFPAGKNIGFIFTGLACVLSFSGKLLAQPLPPSDHRASTTDTVVSTPRTCPSSQEFASPRVGLGKTTIGVDPKRGHHIAKLKQHKSAPAVATLGRLPLAFVENRGQVNEQAKFYGRAGGQTLWLTEQGITLELLRHKRGAANGSADRVPNLRLEKSTPSGIEAERLVITQKFIGSNKAAVIEGRSPQPGAYNYFHGKDPAKWRTGVRGYAEILYHNLWNGIDLKLYGNGPDLEQEFIIRPGANPRQIRVAYHGIEGLRVVEDGALFIKTAFGELQESRPRIYQEIDGKRVEVAGRFKPLSGSSYAFEVKNYEPQYALVIDPTLMYSTYLGGSSQDSGVSIAVNACGNAYVAGWTSSTDFPITPGVFQITYDGAWTETFVTKLNADGTALGYSTYLGGNGRDESSGLAVDLAGNAYVVGSTFSGDFPTTPGSFQPVIAGGLWDGFVTKLSPDGSALVYSSYLGGSGDHDFSYEVAVDFSGNTYVTGETRSNDFPTTPGAFQPSYAGGFNDVFVTKVNADGSALVYSSYLGGSNDDTEVGATRITVDAGGNAYVSGATRSIDFPTTLGAFQPSYRGGSFDAFVTKVNAAGSALVYSSYLGGSNEERGIGGVAVDDTGTAYVTGHSNSADFPTTPGAFQEQGAGGAFVTKVNADGSALVYSSHLSGNGADRGLGIAVDDAGNAYVTGVASSTDFPTVDAFQATYAGQGDAFVTKVNATGSVLVYSSYLGGTSVENGLSGGTSGDGDIAVDAFGNAHVTGNTISTDFPTTPNSFQPTYGGGVFGDAFVAKIGATVAQPACSNQWNIKSFTCDFGHDNSFILQRDGTPVCGSGNCPGAPGSCWGAPVTQSCSEGQGNISWETGSRGELRVSHAQDMQVYGDTFLMVQSPKSLTVPVAADVGRVWLNDADVTESGPAGSITLNLTSGWNHLEWTSYNQNQGTAFELNFPFAGNVDQMVCVAAPPVNSPPISNAGRDQTVNEGALVQLGGSGSDTDGDPLSFMWTQTGGPPVTLSDPTVANPSFRAPFGSATNTLSFELAVSDGQASSSDRVDVTVQDLGASIHGIVRGSTGPIAVAQVTLTRRRTVLRTTTDTSGFYAFTGVVPANYTVTVSRSGFRRQSARASLALGEDEVLDFTLRPR